MAKKTLKILLEVLLYAAIVVGIVWGVPNLLSKKLGTEYPIAAITSGSMWPALKQNDIVFIQAVPKEELKEGDIIVWKNPPIASTTSTSSEQAGFTIHRIVELREDTLVTKGDANFSEDKPVSYKDVVGRTVVFRGKPLRVPFFGYISVIGGKYLYHAMGADSGK